MLQSREGPWKYQLTQSRFCQKGTNTLDYLAQIENYGENIDTRSAPRHNKYSLRSVAIFTVMLSVIRVSAVAPPDLLPGNKHFAKDVCFCWLSREGIQRTVLRKTYDQKYAGKP